MVIPFLYQYTEERQQISSLPTLFTNVNSGIQSPTHNPSLYGQVLPSSADKTTLREVHQHRNKWEQEKCKISVPSDDIAYRRSMSPAQSSCEKRKLVTTYAQQQPMWALQPSPSTKCIHAAKKRKDIHI